MWRNTCGILPVGKTTTHVKRRIIYLLDANNLLPQRCSFLLVSISHGPSSYRLHAAPVRSENEFLWYHDMKFHNTCDCITLGPNDVWQSVRVEICAWMENARFSKAFKLAYCSIFCKISACWNLMWTELFTIVQWTPKYCIHKIYIRQVLEEFTTFTCGTNMAVYKNRMKLTQGDSQLMLSDLILVPIRLIQELVYMMSKSTFQHCCFSRRVTSFQILKCSMFSGPDSAPAIRRKRLFCWVQ
jgi:hypothetical protein